MAGIQEAEIGWRDQYTGRLINYRTAERIGSVWKVNKLEFKAKL